MAGGDVVFICCGKETRHGFTAHLCARLREAGVTVVNGGGDLPRGVNLRQAIRLAIENSSFSVVIISREFASSQFRLDELVHIKQQHAAGCLVCFPVFFHVSPDDDCASLVAGDGSGCFHACFDLHKIQFTYQRVHAWIHALAWLARISGWVLTPGRSEAALVAEIATTIQDRIQKSKQHSATTTSTTSRRRIRSAATLSFHIIIMAAAAVLFAMHTFANCMCNPSHSTPTAKVTTLADIIAQPNGTSSMYSANFRI